MARDYTIKKLTVESLLADTNTLVVDKVNHRVGIGVAAPGVILQIGSTVGTSQSNYIYMGTEGGDVGYYTTGLKLRMHADTYGFDILNVNSATASLAGLNIVRHNNSTPGESALFIQLSTGDVTIAKNLSAAGNITTQGRQIGAVTTQTITAATDEISNATPHINLTASSNITLGSASGEVIDTANAVDGQVVTIINSGADSVITLTCWQAGVSEHSKVTAKDGAATIALTRNATAGKADGATFRYVSALGRWVQIG